ncbi:CAAD domain-containing protein [Prochlorococcus sp. MIT 1341]|uniref:CAAD domain-containing protein n=1 Tax=Prochlorococcus sp. MIT 1341 TaxID=3096221 RepID=UPI002A7479D2|nr:CAAD domain-containing protein [Prochlorococcus sp. MIT 1341]
MSELNSEANNGTTNNTTQTTNNTPQKAVANSGNQDDTINYSEQFSQLMRTVNETLSKVDWTQMGKYGKAAGIITLVIVAQIIIKGVIDTVNLLPVIPGLLELLGLVVVGQWSWQNLKTSDKRNAVIERVQNLRKEYLG